MSLKESAFLGLATALIIYGLINIAGHNYYTWMLQLYSYVILAVLVYIHSNGGLKEASNITDRFLYVVDEEERKVKKLLTGEEFKIQSTEKLQ